MYVGLGVSSGGMIGQKGHSVMIFFLQLVLPSQRKLRKRYSKGPSQEKPDCGALHKSIPFYGFGSKLIYTA